MGLFDSNGNGSNSNGSGDTSKHDPSKNLFGDLSGGMFGDSSGGMFGDASGGMFGGLDASGMDISGIGQIAYGIAQMVGVALVAGIAVALIFVSSQNLVYLTSKEHMASIPINNKAPSMIVVPESIVAINDSWPGASTKLIFLTNSPFPLHL